MSGSIGKPVQQTGSERPDGAGVDEDTNLDNDPLDAAKAATDPLDRVPEPSGATDGAVVTQANGADDSAKAYHEAHPDTHQPD